MRTYVKATEVNRRLPASMFFTWAGGAYVEFGWLTGDDFRAVQCWNVWDYRTDRPTITSLESWAKEFTNDDLERALNGLCWAK